MAAAITASSLSGASAQQSKGKILVVLSSETTLPLKDGKTFETGYYLNELVDPAMRFKDAGYELVFASPKGNTPQVAADSINKMYFGDDEERLKGAQELQKTIRGLDHPTISAPRVRHSAALAALRTTPRTFCPLSRSFLAAELPVFPVMPITVYISVSSNPNLLLRSIRFARGVDNSRMYYTRHMI